MNKPGRNDPCPCGSGKKYKKCCQDRPGSHSPTPAECNQLIALYSGGHYPELENRARLLVNRYPDFGFAWKVLGVTLKALGKDSLSALQKAAELLPDDVEAHNNLGITLQESGQPGKAEAC